MADGRGVLISLEGVDGCGKSSQIRLLRDALLRQGVPVGFSGHPGRTLREPGGTPLGESIRRQLLHHRHDMDLWAEALLYAAARAQLAHTVLEPSLREGWVVLIDRFVDSSLAYQGHARGLGIERVLDLNLTATAGLLPDLTIVIALEAEQAAARRTGSPDRIEREGVALQRRVAEGYREVERRFGHRVRAVDGARSRAEVAADVLSLALAVVGRPACSTG